MHKLSQSWRQGLFLSVGLFLMPAASHAASRTYLVNDFDSVRLEAPIAVAIEAGRGVTARAEGDADLLDRIALDVSGRQLRIRLKPSPFSQRAGGSGVVRLFLTAPALRRLELDSAGTLGAQGLKAQRAEVISAGSGAISVAGVAADNLSITQIGAGSVRLAGKAGSVTVRLSGAGSVDAAALTAADLDLTVEGTGAVQALATRAAKVIAIGSASVTVAGRPACTVHRTGSGAVTCGGGSF